MNYDLTMKELMEIIQKALDGLKGKNVVKEGGIGKLVKAAIDEIEIEGYSLIRYNIDVDHCQLKMYCSGLDNEVKFAEIRQTYKADKRKQSGYGDVLESVTVRLTREIPLDMEVLNVSQFLDYEEAKQNFERLERQQKELLEEYKRNLEGMAKMQDIMKYQAYNNETSRESEKAMETLNSLRLK